MAEAPARPPRARDARDAPPPPAELSEWDQFSRLHDLCYITTDAALAAEENGRVSEAIEGYQRALDLMDEALAMDAGDNEKMATMQDKIRHAKKQALSRIVDAQSAASAAAAPPPLPAAASAPPPSYESLYPAVPAAAGPMYPAVPAEETSVRPQLAERVRSGAGEDGTSTIPVSAAAESEQAAALMEIAEETDGGCISLPQHVDPLFHLPAGAQLFFVAPNGAVSAPSVPQELHLYRFSREKAPAGAPEAFLQVGEWTYPLIPGCSPVLHSSFGPYMFPDLQRPGCHVAVLLPESVSAESRRQFEQLLTELTALVEQPTEGVVQPPHTAPQKEHLSAWLSGGLVKGAELLSKGLVAGAGKLSQYLATGTSQLQSNMAPAAAPVKVDPRVTSGAQTAMKVSKGVLKCSEYVVNQVGRGTMALAAYIAPHVKRTGTKILTKTHVADEKSASGKMDSVLEVAGGAVRGFGIVYTGLEQAATLLASSLANNTVQLVGHRYGAEAGQATESGLYAAGNLAMTGHNVQSLGAKGLAKRVAKDTGKHLISEYEEKKRAQPPRPPPPPM